MPVYTGQHRLSMNETLDKWRLCDSTCAIVTQAAQLHHRADIGETCRAPGIAQGPGQPIIIKVACRTAIVTDQEDTIMPAARMAVSEIGIGAFDPVGEIGPHEQVKNAVNAVGRNPLAPLLSDQFSNVIGRGGPVLRGQRLEHVGAHECPLLPRTGELALCFLDQLEAGVFVMCVIYHGRQEIFLRIARYKQAASNVP